MHKGISMNLKIFQNNGYQVPKEFIVELDGLTYKSGVKETNGLVEFCVKDIEDAFDVSINYNSDFMNAHSIIKNVTGNNERKLIHLKAFLAHIVGRHSTLEAEREVYIRIDNAARFHDNVFDGNDAYAQVGYIVDTSIAIGDYATLFEIAEEYFCALPHISAMCLMVYKNMKNAKDCDPLKVMAKTISDEKERKSKMSDLDVGCVYIIKEEGTNFYKIGKTNKDVKKRLQSIQTGNASKLQIVHEINTTMADELEKRLHHQFANKRILGEWFELSSHDLRHILSL